MARKIKFALKMADGTDVRTLEELRDHFSVEEIYSYMLNGKLLSWLQDRYETGLAEELEKLNMEDERLAEELYVLFEIPEGKRKNVNMGKIIYHENKLKQARELFVPSEHLNKVDFIAFSQEEVYDFLNYRQKEIYLYGEQFEIPLNRQGIHYIGINSPVVIIRSDSPVDWDKLQISLENVTFDENYKKIVKKAEEQDADRIKFVNSLRLVCDPSEELKYLANNPKLIDENGNVFLDLQQFSKNIVSARMCENFVYFISCDFNYLNNKWVAYLHMYDFINKKDNSVPCGIQTSEADSNNFGIKYGTKDWIVYYWGEKLFFYDIKNRKMNAREYNVNAKREYEFTNESRYCAIVDGKFYCYCKEDMFREIDLRTMLLNNIIPATFVLSLEGRLMFDGKNFLCLSYEKDGNIWLHRISYKTGREDKNFLVFKNESDSITTNNMKVIDSLFYNNHIYYILSRNRYLFSSINYELYDYDIDKMKNSFVETVTYLSVNKTCFANMWVKEGRLYYEFYESLYKKDPIKKNSILVGSDVKKSEDNTEEKRPTSKEKAARDKKIMRTEEIVEETLSTVKRAQEARKNMLRNKN